MAESDKPIMSFMGATIKPSDEPSSNERPAGLVDISWHGTLAVMTPEEEAEFADWYSEALDNSEDK